MDAFISLWKVEEAVEERKQFEKMMERKARMDAIGSGKIERESSKILREKEITNMNINSNPSNPEEPLKGAKALKAKFARGNSQPNNSIESTSPSRTDSSSSKLKSKFAK